MLALPPEDFILAPALSAQELMDRAAKRHYDEYEAAAANRLGRELMEDVAPVNKNGDSSVGQGQARTRGGVPRPFGNFL